MYSITIDKSKAHASPCCPSAKVHPGQHSLMDRQIIAPQCLPIDLDIHLPPPYLSLCTFVVPSELLEFFLIGLFDQLTLVAEAFPL
jgi:hypothetical protein